MMIKVTNPIHIVMKNAPGPDSDFIEVENDLGESVKAGEWSRRTDGLWALSIFPGTPWSVEGVLQRAYDHGNGLDAYQVEELLETIQPTPPTPEAEEEAK